MKKLITLSLFTLIISAASLGQKSEKNEIPPEFGRSNEVLLVIDAETNKVSKCLEESLEKYYKGEYEIVQSVGSKYANTDKYRYEMRIITNFKPGQTIGGNRFPPTTDYKYSVLDRRNGRIYQLDYWAGGYKKSMINYIKKLEAARSTNSN